MNRHINFAGKVRRWRHNLSYRNFFSGEIGEMRPVWLEDGVPGDTFEYTPEARIYFAPLLFPVLTKMTCRVDTFFVPNRLAWSEWENFSTGGPDGTLNPAYPSIRHIYSSLPVADQSSFASWFNSGASNINSIWNNLGLPVGAGTPVSNPYDAIPYYDYQFIFDEYYRDEEKEPVSITGYGGIHRDVYDIFQTSAIRNLLYSNTNSGLRNIAWAKDYFTSASLQQQRGSDMPLLSNPIFKTVSGTFDTSGHVLNVGGTATSIGAGSLYTVDGSSNTLPLASVLTINGLRNLFAGSAWYNNNVIGGTRYIEQLRSRYHVVSSDARLQRPEMIGSSYINVNIDVVTQTSSTVTDTDGTQAIGERAGKASIVGRGKTITYSCEEFGYFISIMHIAPKAAYFQGIRRNLQRESRWDFFQPELQFTPQQPIRNNEIWVDPLSSTTLSPETCGTFGFIGVYDEYKHHNDEVHGDFQDTLLAWTMARKFSSLPAADSSAFLRVDHDSQGNNRIFAVPDTEYNHIFGVVNNIVLAKREISNKEPKF